MATDARSQLRELLWGWGPLGVHDYRNEIPDEYDALLEDLMRSLGRGGGQVEVVKWVSSTISELEVTRDAQAEARFIDELTRYLAPGTGS